MNNNTLKEREESWEVPFKKWYMEAYPASWKTHTVVEKIKEIIQKAKKELIEELSTEITIQAEKETDYKHKNGLYEAFDIINQISNTK